MPLDIWDNLDCGRVKIEDRMLQAVRGKNLKAHVVDFEFQANPTSSSSNDHTFRVTAGARPAPRSIGDCHPACDSSGEVSP